MRFLPMGRLSVFFYLSIFCLVNSGYADEGKLVESLVFFFFCSCQNQTKKWVSVISFSM